LDEDIIVEATSGLRRRGSSRRRWIHNTEYWRIEDKQHRRKSQAETSVSGVNWSIMSPTPLQGMAHDSGITLQLLLLSAANTI